MMGSASAISMHGLDISYETSTAAVDPETRISFLFARCRYLSIFRFFAIYLLITT